MEGRAPYPVLDDPLGYGNAQALHAIDAYVTRAMRRDSDLIVFFEQKDS